MAQKWRCLTSVVAVRLPIDVVGEIEVVGCVSRVGGDVVAARHRPARTHARTHTHAACPSGSGSGSWPDAMQPSLLLAGQHTRSVWMHQCWQWAAGGSTIDSSSRVARARVAFVDQLANAVKPVTISAVPKRILRDQTELAVDPRPTREVFVGTRCEKKTTRGSSESVVST
jgi:hypothetical protein